MRKLLISLVLLLSVNFIYSASYSDLADKFANLPNNMIILTHVEANVNMNGKIRRDVSFEELNFISFDDELSYMSIIYNPSNYAGISTIAKENEPLIIFDPIKLSYKEEENMPSELFLDIFVPQSGYEVVLEKDNLIEINYKNMRIKYEIGDDGLPYSMIIFSKDDIVLSKVEISKYETSPHGIFYPLVVTTWTIHYPFHQLLHRNYDVKAYDALDPSIFTVDYLKKVCKP